MKYMYFICLYFDSRLTLEHFMGEHFMVNVVVQSSNKNCVSGDTQKMGIHTFAQSDQSLSYKITA